MKGTIAMKIAVASDFHGNFPNFPELLDQDIDLLLCVGDIAGGSRHTNAQYKSMGNFVKWVKDIAPKKCFITPGNHDFWKWDEVWKYRQNSGLINCLIDQELEFDGLKVYGTPWSLPLFDWNYMLPEDRLELAYDLIPEDTDILMSHGPALGMADLPLEPVMGQMRYTHLGSMALLKALWHRNIKRVFTGHIHSATHADIKLSDDHDTIVRCVSVLNEEYKVKYPPKVFEL